jgi:hypothetical protein
MMPSLLWLPLFLVTLTLLNVDQYSDMARSLVDNDLQSKLCLLSSQTPDFVKQVVSKLLLK